MTAQKRLEKAILDQIESGTAILQTGASQFAETATADTGRQEERRGETLNADANGRGIAAGTAIERDAIEIAENGFPGILV